MKVKAVQKFRDKYTKDVYEPGQVLEVTKKRFEEMNSTKHGVFVEEIKEEPKTKGTGVGTNPPAKGPSPGPVGSAKKKPAKK